MPEKHIIIEHVVDGVNTTLYPETKAEYVNGLSAMIPTVPTNVSEFTNDAGYLTEEQYKGTYSKPSNGIPKSDLTSAVQTSLGKADTALQEQDIVGKEDSSNKVYAWQDTPDNAHYPTEKLVSDSLDGKAASVHTHTKSDISDFPESLPASNTVDTYSSSGTAPVSGKAVSEALNTLGTAASKGVATVVSDSDELVTASAVKTYVDTSSSSGSNYLGTLSALTELSTTAVKGDFYRASAVFDGVHVGDIIIAEKDSPSQAIDDVNWSLLHNEINTDTSVTSVDNHYTPVKSTTKSASGGDLIDITNSTTGTQVVTGLEMDAAGHITGITSVALKSVDTEYSDMVAATSSSDGTHGLVPAPEAGEQTLFLRGDGTWATPAGSYDVATTTENGLMSAIDKAKLDGIEAGANKVEASTTNGNIKINGTETTIYTHPGSGTNPHETTKADIGLENVGNFKAVSTVASQGLTDTEKANARANIGAGTSSFSGSYNDLTDQPTIPEGAAASKGVDTSITEASVSTNLPTSAAVASFVEGKGYKTTDNDTKNTAGSTDTSSKLFLIGATTQGDNPQTYSHDTAYVGTDGCLYSGGTKVLTEHQSLSGYVPTTRTVNSKALSSNVTLAGSDIAITGYSKASSASALATTDTVNTALGKLEKALDGKQVSGDYAASSHTHSAYVNQNAFSNVVVGSTTVAADTATDTLTLVAGTNVTLTPDATNDKITITSKDTTYSTVSASSGGTTAGLCTSGEKYIWNNKASTSVATTSANGLMSSTDKSRLNDLYTNLSGLSVRIVR